jgi:hypothetical protein
MLTAGVRQPAVAMQPVVDPAGWDSAEMASSDRWIFELAAEDIDDLERAVSAELDRGRSLLEADRASFALPVLGPKLDRLRHQLMDGIGFFQMRGFPIDRYSRLEIATAFWGIGTYFGRAVSQNASGHMLGHVIDMGHTQSNPNQRGYQTRETIDYHSDSCDVVGLLCLQPAKTGGLSKVVSSVAIYNEMLRRSPDLVEELCHPFYMDHRGEVREGKAPFYQLPVFNFRDGCLSTRWARSHIESAQRFPEAPRLTDRQIEAFELMDRLCDELRLDIRFEPGDIQFLHNHIMLHTRTAFEDFPDRKRHLYRLWLATDGARPIPDGYAERILGIVAAGTVPQITLEATEAG